MKNIEGQRRLDAAWARHKSGDLAYAYQAYRELLSEFPDDPTTLHYLGLLAHQTGHPQSAIDLIGKSISLDGSDARAFNHLGQIYATSRQLEQAAHCFRTALALDAAFAPALNNLANVLRKMDRITEALELYRHAIASDPTSREAHYNLGKALRDTRAFEEALRAFERAIELDPVNYRACYELALCLEELGRFAEAVDRYRQALSINPDHARSIANLLALRSFVPDAPFVAHASELAASGKIRDEARAKLHQGLGKYHDGQRNYTQAFAHFAASNEVQRKWSKPHDAVHAAKALAALTSRFDMAHFERVRGLGHPSTRPIFIVGMPRSGTTLMEQILGSHPSVHPAGELTQIPRLAARYSELNAETIGVAAQRYLDHLNAIAGSDVEHVTDKLPINYRHLGLIATLFPNARIIHCRRDSRDVALSCFIEMFNIRDQDFTDLTGIAYAIVQHARLMAHWQCVLPIPIYEVRYSQLVADQEVETRRLLEHCGLSWDDRCLIYFKSHRSVDTPSRWQVRQAIYASSVGRWRNYTQQLEPALAILRSEGLDEDA